MGCLNAKHSVFDPKQDTMPSLRRQRFIIVHVSLVNIHVKCVSENRARQSYVLLHFEYKKLMLEQNLGHFCQ